MFRDRPLLHDYWFTFVRPQDGYPLGVQLGCGVTAYSYEDALHLMRTSLFRDIPMPAIATVTEDIDFSTLDAGHVRPNMGVPIVRGVWFLGGYAPTVEPRWEKSRRAITPTRQ